MFQIVKSFIIMWSNLHFGTISHFFSELLYSNGNISKINTKIYISVFLLFNILLRVYLCLCCCLIVLSGYVEVNLRIKNNFNECLPICHWNLNSLCAYNYYKETILYSSQSWYYLSLRNISWPYFPLDDENMASFGYSLVCCDHPSHTKRGDICLYYKIHLPIRVLNISCFRKCLNFELMIGDKSCNFVALCRFPSQS